MELRIILFCGFIILSEVSCQDGPVLLLPTDPPKTTTTTTTTSTTTTTTENFIDEEITTIEPNDDDLKGSWIDNPSKNDSASGNLIDPTHPLYTYPHISCPNYYNPNCVYPQPPPIQIPVPPIINPTTCSPEREIITRCPEGTRQNGSLCVSQQEIHCPSGAEWNENDNRCVYKEVVCPLNFVHDGTKCVERQVCPPNHVWKNGRCTQPDPECPLNYKWNGFQCEVTRPECEHGYVLRNNECVAESYTCPIGYRFVNDQCVKPPVCLPDYEFNYETGFCEKIKLKCKAGTVLINGKCETIEVKCPEGSQLINGLCYEIQTTSKPPVVTYPPPPPDTTRRTTLPPSWDLQTEPNYPTFPTYPDYPSYPKRCPDDSTFYNGQCYRCPPDYSFCSGICMRNTRPCGSVPIPPFGNYPYPPSYRPQYPPHININVKYDPDGGRAPSKPVNIVNNIEPINNTIINFNNITHPITLNNNNENNINIYTETQCADGSIRTTIVKNNETISGCVEADGSPIKGTTRRPHVDDRENDFDDDRDNDNDYDEGDPNRCCEIVTPRQCKKRGEDQWICTHKRYQHCGKFCIADRVYMRPQSNSYDNKVLTLAPGPGSNWSKPCYGRDCPAVDCSGCTDGSFDCSPQCYTYPCRGNSCTFIDADHFCSENAGRYMCN